MKLSLNKLILFLVASPCVSVSAAAADYAIRKKSTNKCVTAIWGNEQNPVQGFSNEIRLEDCNQADLLQGFTIIADNFASTGRWIHSREHINMCIDANTGDQSGGHVYFFNCSNGPNHLWELHSNGHLTNPSRTGKCLAFSDSAHNNRGVLVPSASCEEFELIHFTLLFTPPPTPNPTNAPSDSPSKSPVASPSSSPSAAPSKSPVAAPSAAPSAAPVPRASSGGDPHFKTWLGKKFDFHGGCDLVLLKNPGFANDLGLDVVIRTKIKTFWSYIESAVVRIGPDTLEVRGGEDGGSYWINGELGEKLEDGTKLSISGFSLVFRSITAKQNKFRIDLGNGDAMAVETYKDWVSVNIKAENAEQFQGSAGLMGSYPSGEFVARDGVTVLEDVHAFATEWQVLSNEPMLFHIVEGVQHPMACVMPTAATKQRRLGETLITEEDARIACEHAAVEDVDACIFDVMATNDKEMAGAY